MRRIALMCLGLVLVVWAFLWCPTVACASSEAPIVLAVPTSLGFVEGKEGLNAVNLAVEEINKAGGVKVGQGRRMFRVESIDIRDAAPGVPVPEALLAGMDLIAKYKVPMLGSIAMTPESEAKLQKEPDKYKYVFRVSLNVKYWAGLLMGTMKALNERFGFNKVYLVNQDVLWARGTAKAMADWYPKNGWEVLGQDEFPTGASDFSASLMKTKSQGAQILFTCFDMPQSGILVKQWKSMKVPALMVGFISPMAGQAAWNTFERKIDGLMNAIFELGNIASIKYAPATAFYNAYKAKYGKDIESGHGPAPSYESVYILKEAIERAGRADDPDLLVAELEKTDYVGTVGRLVFNGPDSPYPHDMKYGDEYVVPKWVQWQADVGGRGKREVIYPPQYRTSPYLPPPWLG